MVEIVEITPFSIELAGVHFTDTDKMQQIMDICHRFKHLYKEGYPYGAKTRRILRKESSKRFKKWIEYPEICFTYLVVGTGDGNRGLKIRILVSELDNVLKQHTTSELSYYMQMYLQGVADEITRTIA